MSVARFLVLQVTLRLIHYLIFIISPNVVFVILKNNLFALHKIFKPSAAKIRHDPFAGILKTHYIELHLKKLRFLQLKGICHFY